MLILIFGAGMVWKRALFAEVSEERTAFIITSALMMDEVCSSETSETQPTSTHCYYPKAGSTLIEQMILDCVDTIYNYKLYCEFI
jgi:hypothetical protein